MRHALSFPFDRPDPDMCLEDRVIPTITARDVPRPYPKKS